MIRCLRNGHASLAAIAAIAAALIALAGCGDADRRAGADAAPRVVQVLTGLNNPESCAASADGRWLYVSNCASAEFGPDKRVGLVRGEGAISRVAIAADGGLRLENPRFVAGLSTPLGIAVAPCPVGPYPAGSLFVCVGNALATDARGEPVRDAQALGTAVAVFAAADGRPLGRIELGVGSAVATAIGHPLLLPNGIAIAADGELAVADSGAGGGNLSPPIPAAPGIVRLRVRADGSVATRFIPVPGGPNGVAFHPRDGVLHWVTCGGGGPAGGALFRDGALVAGGLGPCDGLVFTPAGTVLVSRFAGDLVALRPGRAPEPLPLRFRFPSDIRLLPVGDGAGLLLVPEQEAWHAAPWAQGLSVVRLPASF